MEEEKKDNNENANINKENDDRIEELDKNIYLISYIISCIIFNFLSLIFNIKYTNIV